MEIAVDTDAQILGLRGRIVHDEGAYLPWGLIAALDRRDHGARTLRDPELQDGA